MKYLPMLLALIFAHNLYSQNIIGEFWRIDKIIGNDLKNTEEFTLHKINSTKKDDFIYGNKIIFNNDNTFSCSYSARCGNDCFPSSNGTFEMINDTQIKLFLKKFNQVGDCENKQIEPNLDLGTYYISIKSDGIIKLSKM